MRAAKFYGKEDIRIEEWPDPVAKPGQVIVEVEWCGICGSDLHNFVLGAGTIPTPQKPKEFIDDKLRLPHGHELCGRVKGPSAGSKFKDGDAVMIDPHLSCGDCHSCKTANDQSCRALGFIGYSRSGGFAERVVVDEEKLYLLPDNVRLDDAAIIEPLAVVHHAIKVTGLKDWSKLNVLVVGAGPVGIAMIVALRAHGATNIIVSEPALARRKLMANNVRAVINPLEQHVGAKCYEMTNDIGVDVVFDCAGVLAGIESAFDALRLHGLWANVAVWEKPLAIPAWKATLKEIKICFSMAYNDEDFAEVMEMIGSGKFKGFEHMITGRIGLEDIVDKGFNELINNKDKHIKILVTPKQGVVGLA